MIDDRGLAATARIEQVKAHAQNAERALATLRDNLGKLGNTIYSVAAIHLDVSAAWFIPAAALNALRREAVEALESARTAAYRRPERLAPLEPPAIYPEDSLTYLGNVFNAKARAFYEKHGVRLIEPAYECQQERGEVSLMVTKHCIRFSLNLCPKQVKGIRPEPLILINGQEKLTLRFDCKPCEMHVIGRLRNRRSSPFGQ